MRIRLDIKIDSKFVSERHVRGHSLVVEQLVANQLVGVRFSLPAQNPNDQNFMFWSFGFMM